METPVSRLLQSNAAQGEEFFYESFGPETITLEAGWELLGGHVSWYRLVQPERAGYYKVSMSIRRISGDVNNVELSAGSTPNGLFRSSGSHVAGVVPYEPDPDVYLGMSAAMNLEGSSAQVSVSGFICSWS